MGHCKTKSKGLGSSAWMCYGKFSVMVLLSFGCLVIMGPERLSSKVIVIFKGRKGKRKISRSENFPQHQDVPKDQITLLSALGQNVPQV